jgi:hypothetical protein
MTQELVLLGLLTGLIGLVWIMTLAIWEGKPAAGQAHESKSSGNSDDNPRREAALKHQTIAA